MSLLLLLFALFRCTQRVSKTQDRCAPGVVRRPSIPGNLLEMQILGPLQAFCLNRLPRQFSCSVESETQRPGKHPYPTQSNGSPCARPSLVTVSFMLLVFLINIH